MSFAREEGVWAEHHRARRASALWGLVVPAAILPLIAFEPIVGVPLLAWAVIAAWRVRRGVAIPFAYGACHWRLVAQALRYAVRVQLVVGSLTTVFLALFWTVPRSDGAAMAAISLGVVLFFSTMYALGVPRDVIREHQLALLMDRKVDCPRIGWEAMILMMKRAEDIDRRAVLLFGEPFVSPAVESPPPFKAAFDDLPDDAALFDRLTTLADSFAADPDADLAEALRSTAAAVEAARAAGARCRLVAVPPYPSGQALDLMGSIRRYA